METKTNICRAISLTIFIAIVLTVSIFALSQRQVLLIPRITSASPNPAKLEIGGTEISIVVKGYYLNLISGVTILQGDRIVPSTEIVISLAGTPTQTAATITLKATAQAIAGTDYRLRARYGTRSVEISTSVLNIELYKLTALPIPRPPTVIKEEPPPGIIMVNTTTLSSGKFNDIVARIFYNAYFFANSGWNQNQITSFSVANLCYIEEAFPERLDYPFNPTEIASCVCKNPYTLYSGDRKRKAIRGYLNNQKTGPWIGSIAQGKLNIMLRFNDKHFIKTRALDKNYDGQEYVPWDDNDSDRYIADYCCAGLGMDILIVPVVISGNISYSDVTTTWANLSNYEFCASLDNDSNTWWGFWCLGNTEQSLIIGYRDKINEILRSRARDCFRRDDVRNYITEALNKEIKSGNFSGLNIVSISGLGSDLTITFDKYVPKY